MNEETNNQQQPPIKPSKERVIKPSASIIQEVEAQKQQAAAQSISSTINTQPAATYPEPAKSIDQSDLSASQHYALASTKMRAKESGKPVSLRVKSVLVVAILGILAAIYTLIESFTTFSSESFGTVFAIIGLIQFSVSVYLFIGKDHNTVALVLKVYLIFQLISLFLSLANPTALIIDGMITLFLFYVYTRVKSLSYY